MNIEIDDAILRLGENRNLTLQNNSGACVHVHWGRVWITREGDSKDHIVGSGESLAIGRAGATVLTAMSDSGVSVMQRCNRVAEQDMAADLNFATTGTATMASRHLRSKLRCQATSRSIVIWHAPNSCEHALLASCCAVNGARSVVQAMARTTVL